MKKVLVFFLALVLVLPVSVSGVLAFDLYEYFENVTLYRGHSVWHNDATNYKSTDINLRTTYRVKLTSTSVKNQGISFAIPNNLWGNHLVYRPYEDDRQSTYIAQTVDFYNVIFSSSWAITGNYYSSYSPDAGLYILKSSLNSNSTGEYVNYDGSWRP